VVKVRFENFIEAWNYHNTLAKRTFDYTEKNNNLRKEADELILQVWNEVENYHNALPEELRKPLSEEYGIIYFLQERRT